MADGEVDDGEVACFGECEREVAPVERAPERGVG
jgi:hypothetical protein